MHAAIVFSFFQTLSIESIRKMLTLLDLNVSKSTVLKAIATVSAEKFATHAAVISKKLGETNFLMADETRIRIGKKRGYAWAFIGQYGIKIVTHQSRGQVVVDLHCPHYSGGRVWRVKTIQRCWAHILREAELLAATQGGLLIELHHELQYHARLLPPDISDEGLQIWTDKTTQIAQIYQKLGHDFGVTLLNVVPNIRYPGMPPTNNKSERTLRRPVLHRKIRLMFRTDTVRWDDQDQNLLRNIHRTITA